MIEAVEEMKKGVGKWDLLAEASQAKTIVKIWSINNTQVGRKVVLLLVDDDGDDDDSDDDGDDNDDGDNMLASPSKDNRCPWGESRLFHSLGYPTSKSSIESNVWVFVDSAHRTGKEYQTET